MSRSSRASTGCLIAFGTPFALAGIYAGVTAVRLYVQFGWTRTTILFACAAFAFGFAGFGMMATALWGSKRTYTDDDLRARHPDQPWMWNAEWVARRISDQSRSGTFLLWGFALLWTAISSPAALVFIPDAIRDGNPVVFVALLFPLVGLLMLINAARLTLRALRFRRSTLILDTMPAPIGGTLRGRVEVEHSLTSATEVMIRLIALERQRSGKSTVDTIVAHEERELAPGMLQRTASGTVIPIEIAVPLDAPATDATEEERKVYWRLTVDADLPGIDYSASFDDPVFKTEFSDFRPHGVKVPVAAPVDPKSFIERQTPEGRELYFPRFREPAQAFMSLLFTTIWLGAIAFMVVIEVPMAIPIIFGLIAIPIVFSTLDHFFETRSILLGAHAVTVSRRLLSKKEKVIAYTDIESAKAVVRAAANSARPSYRIDIHTKAGKRIKAAKNIRSKREAEWVASRIKGRFGMPA